MAGVIYQQQQQQQSIQEAHPTILEHSSKFSI